MIDSLPTPLDFQHYYVVLNAHTQSTNQPENRIDVTDKVPMPAVLGGLASILLVTAVQGHTSVTLPDGSGTVVGTELTGGIVRQWLGVPYASPPTHGQLLHCFV